MIDTSAFIGKTSDVFRTGDKVAVRIPPPEGMHESDPEYGKSWYLADVVRASRNGTKIWVKYNDGDEDSFRMNEGYKIVRIDTDKADQISFDIEKEKPCTEMEINRIAADDVRTLNVKVKPLMETDGAWMHEVNVDHDKIDPKSISRKEYIASKVLGVHIQGGVSAKWYGYFIGLAQYNGSPSVWFRLDDKSITPDKDIFRIVPVRTADISQITKKLTEYVAQNSTKQSQVPYRNFLRDRTNMQRYKKGFWRMEINDSNKKIDVGSITQEEYQDNDFFGYVYYTQSKKTKKEWWGYIVGFAKHGNQPAIWTKVIPTKNSEKDDPQFRTKQLANSDIDDAIKVSLAKIRHKTTGKRVSYREFMIARREMKKV